MGVFYQPLFYFGTTKRKHKREAKQSPSLEGEASITTRTTTTTTTLKQPLFFKNNTFLNKKSTQRSFNTLINQTSIKRGCAFWSTVTTNYTKRANKTLQYYIRVYNPKTCYSSPFSFTNATMRNLT